MSAHDNTSEWFLRYCGELEEAIGRGWKRRLAEKVGVAETNVQTWLKSGRVPPAVRRAIMLGDELEELRREHEQLESLIDRRWIEAETTNGETHYSVHEMNEETGIARLVAGHIPRIKDARELANLPAIRARIDKALSALDLENMCDHPDDQRYVKALMDPGWDAETPRERRAALSSAFKANKISDVSGIAEIEQEFAKSTKGKERK